MELFNSFGIDIGYVVIGMAGIILLLFILLIVSMVKIHNIRIRYNQFMEGEDGKNLEKAVLDKFEAIDMLKNNASDISIQIKEINKILETTYKKIALVKYDAFQEIGGKLSFVLVMLTSENNGFILNSMHSSREGCYTYAKEVINGETFVTLSEEEQQALNEAKQDIGLIKMKDRIEQQ
ncbi:MAG: DUF4446 family protein [Lachnospiraceae bacterium]|nr:DUF4446 family protein [Lachnospiraceae bacterium]